MGKILIIAEKPAVARDLAAAVPGDFDKRDGFLENGQYIVSWAFGHWWNWPNRKTMTRS